MVTRITALNKNVQKQHSNLNSKGNKNWNVMYLFDNKIMDLISYLLGDTVNSYENVTCKENIFFKFMKFEIFNLKNQGPFQDLLLKMGHFSGHLQDKIKFQDISRISRTSSQTKCVCLASKRT